MNIIVGIGEYKVTDNPAAVLITYSLGSCIGVTVYDPVVKVGGMLHFMLPEARISPDRAKERPGMFADTGFPLLLEECQKLGADRKRMSVKVAGGAQILDAGDHFKIGKRNYVALRKVLWQNRIFIDGEDIGGCVNRTMRLELSTGKVLVKVLGNGVKEL